VSWAEDSDWLLNNGGWIGEIKEGEGYIGLIPLLSFAVCWCLSGRFTKNDFLSIP